MTDIAEFEAKYKESEEELADLKSAYIDGEGDMNFILDNVLCSTLDDEARFIQILRDLIRKKELPDFKNFTKESTQRKKQRKRRLEGEKVEAEAYAQELGLGDGQDALQNLIMKRQAQREKDSDSFLDQLAAKYAQPKAKAKGKKKWPLRSTSLKLFIFTLAMWYFLIQIQNRQTYCQGHGLVLSDNLH